MKNIYKITNNINGKIYIGKTIDTLDQRFKEHISEANRYKNCLDLGIAFNYVTRLYPAIIKYGAKNFSIDLVESCSEDVNLEKKEIYYIDLYQSQNPDIGYNISPGGLGGPLFKGHHHSADTKKKQSERQKDKKWYNNGLVEIMILKNQVVPENFIPGRIYKGLSGKDNPMYGKKSSNSGKKLSEETKRKLSATKKRNAKYRNKIWVNNGVKELQIDLNRQEIPESFIKGRLPTISKNKRKVIMYDIIHNTKLKEFESLTSAERSTGISIGSILACCSGRTKSAGGYYWKYSEQEKLSMNSIE